jgi:trans-aconitate 2-methyltransferase
MSESIFVGKVFTAPPARIARFTELFVRLVPAECPLRVLDLGCGTGEQIRAIASRLPQAEFVGIDISGENIALARDQSRGLGSRVSFVECDYLEYQGGPFEAIIADSVLQNLGAEDAHLYPKLAGDLRMHGVLAASIPYECAYNSVLWSVRRIARRLQGRAFESAVLGVAKLVHREWDDSLLRERLPYLYLLPLRIDSRAMRESLSRSGLVFAAAEALPQLSPAQPRHRFIAFRRVAP